MLDLMHRRFVVRGVLMNKHGALYTSFHDADDLDEWNELSTVVVETDKVVTRRIVSQYHPAAAEIAGDDHENGASASTSSVAMSVLHSMVEDNQCSMERQRS